MPDAIVHEYDDSSIQLAPRAWKLVRNPLGILKAIGAVVVSYAKQCFERQAFGKDRWPERYPNQAEPFINVAGAVQDLAQGPSIKQRRFQRRPAGIDRGYSGGLAGSITFRVVGEKILEVGSPMDHASTINRGGVSLMRISDVVRKNLAKLMKRARGVLRRGKMGRNLHERYAMARMFRRGMGARFALANKELQGSEKTVRKLVENTAIMRLGFLFNRKKKTSSEKAKPRRLLETHVAQRRFLGLTPELTKEIKGLVVARFKGAA